jgi:hypothetical protein
VGRVTDRRLLALVLGALLAVPGTATAATRSQPVGVDAAKPYFDSRASDRSRAARAGATVAAARPSERTRAARRDLKRSLGRGGVLTIDPLSGTPRQLLRTDGALSGPRGGARADIARDFVRANRSALGLDAADLDGLDLDRRATTPDGLTVVHFRQLHRGIPAFDNDLRVAIDRAGRVLSVAGAPRRDLAVESVEPSLSGAEALARLQRNVGVERPLPVRSGPTGARRTTTFAGDDFARLVLFGTASGAKLAWHVTYRATSTGYYDAVVDASSGAILYRQNLTKAAANANVYRNHPSSSAPTSVDLEDFGLPASSTVLDGEFSRQWADLNDDDDNPAAVDAGEETTPSSGTDFEYEFTAFTPFPVACTAIEPCAWDNTAGTRTTNRLQNGVQAFYLVSRFHDHLEDGPAAFTNAWGNFEKVGGDAVRTQTSDGASSGPDADHRNNANMSTPPNGIPPTMQMYLFRDSGSPTAPDFRSINGGDDSGVVWHEYTHGLSNRLVTNADGTGALNSWHSGAMGEGWSDWYASDLQVRDGLKTDTATAGQIDIGDYSDADLHTLRSQALDCPVLSVDVLCPGGVDTAGGGYTLGDFGSVFNGPQVHADGEIWAETLWDLRRAIGSDMAEALVTDGMRLSPPEPSMLDMRDAILAAEQGRGGGLHDEVREVFRFRGMGHSAVAFGGNDTEPVEDFTLPPGTAGPKGTVTGVVTDSDSGLPVAGVRVGFGGRASRPGFDSHLADQTDADGRYTITDVPAIRYPKLAFFASPGYDPAAVRDVSIAADAATTHDIRMTRDWAALRGGAVVRSVSDDTGDPFDCGADEAFDQSRATVWSSFNPTSEHPANPQAGSPTVVLQLPDTVDVTSFLIDPTAGCGNGRSSSTREYTIKTSTDGTTFRTAVDGRGASGFTEADLGRLSRRVPAGDTGRAVRFIQISLLSPLRQGDECLPQACSGTEFIDLTELKVLGGDPNALPSGPLTVSKVDPAPNEPITFDATLVTDPDSAITGYVWDFDGDGTVDRTTATPATDFAYGVTGSFNAKVAVTDFRGGQGTATTPVTVVTPAPGPPAGPGPATLAPLPSIRLPRTGRRASIRPSVRCALRCSVRAKLTVSRTTARRLKRTKRTLVTLRRTLTTTERRRLRVVIPAKVRRAAKRAGLKTIRATLTVKATYTGGRSKTRRRAVRIRL